jgi:hypothetical protein
MAKKEKIQIEVEVSSDLLNVQHATCINGHLLRDESFEINGNPALKLKVKNREEEGIIYLDPVYGSHDNKEEGISIPNGDIVDLFCPECGLNLKDPEDTCKSCSAPMFVIHLPHGGIAEGCLRKGCLFHKMKIIDAEQQIARTFQNRSLESYL